MLSIRSTACYAAPAAGAGPALGRGSHAHDHSAGPPGASALAPARGGAAWRLPASTCPAYLKGLARAAWAVPVLIHGPGRVRISRSE